MRAAEAKLLEFLKNSPQFVVPIYQRTYSWREKECGQLWEDIIRTGSSDAISAHFVGSIMYIEKGLSNLTIQEPMLVIDGQQRLPGSTRRPSSRSTWFLAPVFKVGDCPRDLPPVAGKITFRRRSSTEM